MCNTFLVLLLHLSSNPSVSWLLLIVVVAMALKQLSKTVIVILALLSDKVNARLVKIIQASKRSRR